MPSQPAPQHQNRLSRESSPYLLQHAANPVDWFPWGESAFQRARELNRPIFLSIGYSTCYWCHVMERETFEDESAAEVLNQSFVSIKVDREERPDVDEIYMAACQIFSQFTTGRAGGGWPLSAFLEPESLKPFYVGTYFPPIAAYGRPSFRQICESIQESWQERRPAVLQQAERIAEAVKNHLAGDTEGASVGDDEIRQGQAALMGVYDHQHGGFGSAPKFPQPPYLELLMRTGWQDPGIRNALLHTLESMALGGMHDQIGGGFHRYSVDAQWVIPHFEKMLYDQGQLLSLYARAHERTTDVVLGRAAEGIVEFVARELIDEEGAFFSALDAEVESREGGNYVWTAGEIRSAFKDAALDEDADAALKVFGLDAGPNFRDPHAPDAPPVNVLILRNRPDSLAAILGWKESDFIQRLDRWRSILRQARDRRPQPRRDEKVIASWNGLMIAGLVDAGSAMKRSEWVAMAAKAAGAILNRLWRDGTLHRSTCQGIVGPRGVLEDYGAMIYGLIRLAGATHDDHWRRQGVDLLEAADGIFGDGRGGFYENEAGRSDLFCRARAVHDGAVPSGTSLMIASMLEVADQTGDATYHHRAEAAIRSVGSAICTFPLSLALTTAQLVRLDCPRSERRCASSVEPMVAVHVDRISVNPDRRKSRMVVTLSIPDGLHLKAPADGQSAFQGLEIRVEPSTIDYALEFPSAGDQTEDGLSIFRGSLEVGVRLESSQPLPDDLHLHVRYQVCTEFECLAPTNRSFQVSLR